MGMMLDLAVIPVAGLGTRLWPLTKSQPKEMLPLGRKPVVEYIIEELARSGIRRFLFITGPGKVSIENHLESNGQLTSPPAKRGIGPRESAAARATALAAKRRPRIRPFAGSPFVRFAPGQPGREFLFTRQDKQLGLGHAVRCAAPLVGDQPFALALGDMIIGLHGQSRILGRMIETFEKCRADAVIALGEVARSDVVHYGIAQPREKIRPVFELADVVEKPRPEEARSRLAVAGRYVFGPGIFRLLEETPRSKNGEIQLTDAIRMLISRGAKVVGMRLTPDEPFFDIGNFQSYIQAFCQFALADQDYGPNLRQYLGRLIAAPIPAFPQVRNVRAAAPHFPTAREVVGPAKRMPIIGATNLRDEFRLGLIEQKVRSSSESFHNIRKSLES
jgi:UTP--glucose-1-phosphate uridylyltransferase